MDNDKIYDKLKKQGLSDIEIAESFVFGRELTQEEKEATSMYFKARLRRDEPGFKVWPTFKRYNLEEIPPHGRFGGSRRYDVHTGVDLYCPEGTVVVAIEPGKVVNVCDFTGAKVDSPWWEDTKAVLVEGDSGVILYGEVNTELVAGAELKTGQLIGTVKKVLKRYKGLPMTMLHLELHEKGYNGSGEWWRNGNKPSTLLNIEELLLTL